MTVWQFFRKELGISYSEDFRGCLYVPEECRGRVMSPEHVAVAIGYNGFNGYLCMMHVVIQKPEYISRRIIREAFEFPFVDCGRSHVIAPVDSKNEKALEFDRRLGFTEFARFPGGGPDGDMVMLRMAAEDCRWLHKKVVH